MTTTATTKEIEALEKRIATLAAEPRALIGSDEGTSSAPDSHRIYEEITGERYATYSFAGSNATRCTVESAEADTHGRIRWFRGEMRRIAGLRAELEAARKQLMQLRR